MRTSIVLYLNKPKLDRGQNSKERYMATKLNLNESSKEIVVSPHQATFQKHFEDLSFLFLFFWFLILLYTIRSAKIYSL